MVNDATIVVSSIIFLYAKYFFILLWFSWNGVFDNGIHECLTFHCYEQVLI